ncbi:MAG: hypothetical protein ABI614_20075 [Planctomycetota bacterium]
MQFISSADAAWKAGMAMSGYGGRDKPAEGKLTDLWAKAAVLEDASGNRGVIVTLDLVGIDRTLSLAIRDSLIARQSEPMCVVGFLRVDILLKSLPSTITSRVM